jgi:hypothetical protein
VDRLEPALDAAHQPVVFEALVVRLVRLPPERPLAGTRGERAVAPPAVAVPFGQVGVEREVVPARGEGRPVVQMAHGFEPRAELAGGHEGESVAANSFPQRVYDLPIHCAEDRMNGLMMEMPLLVSSLLQHADRHHGGHPDRVAPGRRRHPPLHLPRRARPRPQAGERPRAPGHETR